jgi:hypothetical protein
VQILSDTRGREIEPPSGHIFRTLFFAGFFLLILFAIGIHRPLALIECGLWSAALQQQQALHQPAFFLFFYRHLP